MENLSMGDNIYCQDDTIIVHFLAPRKVLSTAVYNGGYREDLQRITEVLLEAEQRGLWKGKQEAKAELQKLFLSLEGELEEKGDK